MSKVVVAMSGGVDSSVAAVLLKEQGYDVTGVMLRLWSEPGREDSNRCCTPDAMGQARRVAARLEIPFYVLDAKDVFYKTIIPYFLEGYANGGTPNPCIMCNRSIRWEFLFDYAVALGADYMSTGHYVRKATAPDGRHLLLKGIDTGKDQSYVLHVLSQEKLSRALFPVGDFAKPEIRKIAENAGLSVAHRPDSQDLCFLAGDDYRSFITRHEPSMFTPGDVVNLKGEILGRHNGLPNYTIGQRKGLGITTSEPMYVIKKDIPTNTLVVGIATDLGTNDLMAININWTCGLVPDAPFQAMVKTRYTALPASAKVIPMQNATRAVVQFESNQRDITSGQAAVFYDGDVVIGGGIISSIR